MEDVEKGQNVGAVVIFHAGLGNRGLLSEIRGREKRDDDCKVSLLAAREIARVGSILE